MKYFSIRDSDGWNTDPMVARQGGHLPEFGLADIIAMVWHYRMVVVITTLAMLAVAMTYGLVRDRYYVAETRIFVDPIGPRIVDRDVLGRENTSDAGIAIVESQMRIMTSASVLSKVIKEQNLLNDNEFAKGSTGILSLALDAFRGLTGREGKSVSPDIRVLYTLQKATSTKRPQQSYIVDLHVKTKDPRKSARLSNAIAQTYIASEADVRSSVAQAASGTLESRLSTLRTELNDAEAIVERFKKQNNIVDSNGSRINEQDLEQLNKSLSDAQARTTLARTNLEQIRAARASARDLDNIPEALTSSTISGLRIRLSAALQRLSILSADLLPSHPTLAAARAEADVVRQQIRDELTRHVGRAEAELTRAENEQRQIENRLASIRNQTFETNDARIRLRELTRDAEAKRVVYEAFLLRAKELGEQKALELSKARIISAAVPPIRPDGLSGAVVMVLGLIAGMITGTVLAIARGLLDLWQTGPAEVPTAPDPHTPPTGSYDRQSYSSRETFDPRNHHPSGGFPSHGTAPTSRSVPSSEWEMRRRRMDELASQHNRISANH